MYLLKIIQNKVIKRLLITVFKKTYKSPLGKLKAYISYIPEPFSRQDDLKYMSGHQNRPETIIIGEIFRKLNYSFVVERPEKYFPANNSYDIVFGIGINFEKISNGNPKSLKIYYATGAFFEHQNKMVINRTDEFNIKNDTNLSYQRLANPSSACDIADYIIQIGTKYTLDSYPKKYLSKILFIDQSCEEFPKFSLQKKQIKINKQKFLWLGSGGSILKGLDLLIEFFKNNLDFELNIVGNLDNDFYNHYENVFMTNKNIILHGYKYIHAPDFYELAKNCSFVVFPSGSEGCPGSVINLMKLGLIPIVSKWAAVDNIDELGILIEELSDLGLSNAILKSQNLSEIDISDLSRRNSKYANKKYNIKEFERQFQSILDYCISDFNSKSNLN